MKAVTAQELRQRQCEPCEGGVEPLDDRAARSMLAGLADDWQLDEDASAISRTVRFAGFNRTIAFVNAVAWIASTEGHHPSMEVSYGRCRVTYTTNAIHGLSANDFICAAKIDALLEDL
jgi:4a-hydroxytetrahydrobiopterin dehydratase